MRIAILTALAVAASSCASSQKAEKGASPTAERDAAAASPSAPRHSGMAMHCPMAVPGTTVSAQDTAQGEALIFTTNSGAVDELRQRVRAMADMHNHHHASGDVGTGTGKAGTTEGAGESGGGGMMGHGHMHGSGGMMMPPPSRASVEDVEGGARLEVVPRDPADAERLRSTVRAHSEHMRDEGCGGMMDRGAAGE